MSSRGFMRGAMEQRLKMGRHLIGALVAIVWSTAAFAQPLVRLEPYRFKTDSAARRDAELGRFNVREHRVSGSARQIELAWSGSEPG
jgi:hypothetical protein